MLEVQLNDQNLQLYEKQRREEEGTQFMREVEGEINCDFEEINPTEATMLANIFQLQAIDPKTKERSLVGIGKRIVSLVVHIANQRSAIRGCQHIGIFFFQLEQDLRVPAHALVHGSLNGSDDSFHLEEQRLGRSTRVIQLVF